MITITETALRKVAQLGKQFSEPVKGLRVSAIPRSPIRASFTMKLIPEGEPESPADIVQSFDEVDVYIDADSAPYLEAASIDYVFTPMASGFKVVAPPRKLDTPEGALAERIQKILDEQINRSLFLHGGGATLIDVKGGSVFLENNGGWGARTNRESPVNTVYAAYTGCLPKYGSHLDENRAAKCIVELDDEVRDNVKGMADWGCLRRLHRCEGTTWIYANPEALVDAAVNGVFKPTARWDYWSQPKEMRLPSELVQPLYDGALPIFS